MGYQMPLKFNIWNRIYWNYIYKCSKSK